MVVVLKGISLSQRMVCIVVDLAGRVGIFWILIVIASFGNHE